MTNAESTQLRAQLAQQAESLQSARERLDAARADVPELEDKLMARGDRISALEAELLAQTATPSSAAARNLNLTTTPVPWGTEKSYLVPALEIVRIAREPIPNHLAASGLRP